MLKETLLDTLYFAAMAILIGLVFLLVVFLLMFLKILYINLFVKNCRHNQRQMTDLVGSPITCMECGKILNK
jgi:uncharacterized membrane protein YqjE